MLSHSSSLAALPDSFLVPSFESPEPTLVTDQQDLSPFAARVMSDVNTYFEGIGHKPSFEVYSALAHISEVALKVVRGEAKAAMHICGLDVGTGKTTTLRHTIRRLRLTHPQAGIVLCLGRLEQIEAMTEELRLKPSEYAVLAGKGAIDSQGRRFAELGVTEARINAAPILLTTHAQLELRLHYQSWADASAFYYRGAPRILRVWDEAIQMRRHITLTDSDLHAILWVKRYIPAAIRSYARQVLDLLEATEDRGLIDLPTLDAVPPVAELLAELPERTYKEVGPLLRDLLALSGKQRAIAVKDGEDTVLLQYDLNLPSDLLPILVLDASARDRLVYQQQPEDVVWLRHASKRYDKLQINTIPGPSGKRAFWKDYQARIAWACEIVLQNPDRTVLIIHPKESKKGQAGMLAEEMRKHLNASDSARVKLLHWGAHDAVNDFRDCNLVIALTLFHFPHHAYEIIGRAAADCPVDQLYSSEEIGAVQIGEILAHIRQGFGRSCIRQMDGDQARECIAYVYVPTKSRIKKQLSSLFPGCKVIDSSGRLDREQQVLSHLSALNCDEVTYPEIYKDLGVSKQHFTILMRNESLRSAIEGDWRIIRSRPNKLIRRR